MDRTRTLILRLTVVLLSLLVAGTLLLLVHPILFTGRFYELTIRKVDFGPDGMVSITYDDVLTYDSSVLWRYPAPNGTTFIMEEWEGRPRTFLRWPTKDRNQNLTLYLTTTDERSKGVGDSPAIRQRWLLKEGTYRLRPGEQLVAARILESDGTTAESIVEITPTP